MPETKILVIDDDASVRAAVQNRLEGAVVDRVLKADLPGEGIRMALREQPDAILLDINMPQMDGFKVCRHLKENSATRDIPILFLTVDANVTHLAKALDCGGSDYIRKPFRADELLARVRAVFRRSSAGRGERGRGDPSGYELDRRRHEIRWQGEPLPATVIEFRLLRAMVERLGEVVTHGELLAAGWPDVPDPDPLWLKPHLARLREKLVSAGAPVPVAVRGVGYRLDG